MINKSNGSEPRLAKDSGGEFGNLPPVVSNLGEMVREELTSSLDPNVARRFPSSREIAEAIKLFVPPEDFNSMSVVEASDLVSGVIKAVRRNVSKTDDMKISSQKALSVACEAVTTGLVDSIEIENTPAASRSEKLRQICRQDESILVQVKSFTPPPVPPPQLTFASVGSSSGANDGSNEGQSPNSQRAVAVVADRLAMTASKDPAVQAKVSERITDLVNSGKVSPVELEDLQFFASGTGRMNAAGELVVNKTAPHQTDITTILSLLEDNVSVQMITVLIHMKGLIGEDVEFPDLIEDARLQTMRPEDFAEYMIQEKNLNLDTFEAFCDEFGLDLDAVAMSGRHSSDFGQSIEATEEIAEGILFAMSRGKGRTMDDKLESVIKRSRESKYHRGDLRYFMDHN